MKEKYPQVKTFTTAHMCGSPSDWRTPVIPCSGGVPVQDPAQIKRRNIDYMCPILDWVKPGNISYCEDEGLPMWMYVSLEPAGRFNNFRLDNPLHEPRLLFWQIAQLRLTGFLYWDLNAWEGRTHPAPSHTPIDGDRARSPYIDPSEWTPVQTPGSGNDVGDGKLLYAGSGGLPIASIRLHAIRDGIEDHAYLTMLKALRGDAAMQAAIAPVSNPNDLQQHVDSSVSGLSLLMKQRSAVAADIEAAQWM